MTTPRSTRAIAPLFLAILATLSTGCVSTRKYRLPPISADEVTVIHTDWFGSIKAKGTDMRVTEKYLTWAEATWEIQYGGWHDYVQAKGYRQRREDVDPK